MCDYFSQDSVLPPLLSELCFHGNQNAESCCWERDACETESREKRTQSEEFRHSNTQHPTDTSEEYQGSKVTQSTVVSSEEHLL